MMRNNINTITNETSNTLKNITWRTVEKNPNYEINNYGEIRDRYTKESPFIYCAKNNYLKVKLDSTCYLVHRLVAQAFPEICGEWREYHEGYEVDHINTNREDNRPENLRVVSRKDNANNPLTLEHKSQAVFSTSNPNHKGILQYSLSGDFIAFYPTISDAERAIGQKPQKSHISACAKGKQPKAHGYVWRYAISETEAPKYSEPVSTEFADYSIQFGW